MSSDSSSSPQHDAVGSLPSFGPPSFSLGAEPFEEEDEQGALDDGGVDGNSPLPTPPSFPSPTPLYGHQYHSNQSPVTMASQVSPVADGPFPAARISTQLPARSELQVESATSISGVDCEFSIKEGESFIVDKSVGSWVEGDRAHCLAYINQLLSVNQAEFPLECNVMFPLWSFNVSGRAQRHVVASYQGFWAAYSQMPPEKRVFYEITQPNRPCKLFLDLDSNKSVMSAEDFESRVYLLYRLINEMLWKHYGVQVDSVMWLTSSKGEKLSMHLIWLLEGSTMFADVAHLKQFMKLFPQLHVVASNNLFGILDMSVYKFGAYRLVYSTKMGQDREFVPLEGAYSQMNATTFFASLVQHVPSRGPIRLLKCTFGDDHWEIPKDFSQQNQQSQHPRANPVLIGGALEQLLRSCITRETGIALTTTKRYPTTIIFNTKNRDCPMKRKTHGRAHVGNTIYFVVHFRHGTYEKRCHDAECKELVTTGYLTGCDMVSGEPLRFSQIPHGSSTQVNHSLRVPVSWERRRLPSSLARHLVLMYHPERVWGVIRTQVDTYLFDKQYVFGRDEGADFVVRNPNVSNQHLRLLMEGGTVSLQDTSTNGSWVGGVHPLEPAHKIRGTHVVTSNHLGFTLLPWDHEEAVRFELEIFRDIVDSVLPTTSPEDAADVNKGKKKGQEKHLSSSVEDEEEEQMQKNKKKKRAKKHYAVPSRREHPMNFRPRTRKRYKY